MAVNRKIRRVTKKVYNQYSISDYGILSDNLNPVNPTQLESQYQDMVIAVQKRVLAAYEKANVTAPQDLFSPDVSPSSLLNDINSLMRKIKGNPLEDLYGDLGNLDVLAAFVSTGSTGSTGNNANDLLGNPLKLDCSGIELTLKNGTTDSTILSGTDDEDSDNEDAGTDDEDDFSSFKVTYKGINTADLNSGNYPTEILQSECPFTLAVPAGPGTNEKTIFRGWYLDEIFNSKVPNNTLDYPGKDITLYAYFADEEDDDSEDENGVADTGSDLGGEDLSSQCDLIELSFLKIILIIIQVGKILINVLVLVLNIAKVAADIMKDAQLCWINPPSLQSLISYVSQRLSAIVFQVIGMILLKLWSMLNLDCISSNTVNTISEINAALSGVTDLLGSIEPLAISFNETVSKDTFSTLKDSLSSLKAELAQRSSDVWDQMSNITDQLKASGVDLADTYTNPKTYLSIVPSEIAQPIVSTIDSIDTTKENIKKLQETIAKLTNKNATVQNSIPKGTEVNSL